MKCGEHKRKLIYVLCTLMNFEGVVMKLERHDLVGQFDSLAIQVDCLYHIFPHIIGSLGVRTCISMVKHRKSKKN
jgi:hypothetical protein